MSSSPINRCIIEDVNSLYASPKSRDTLIRVAYAVKQMIDSEISCSLCGANFEVDKSGHAQLSRGECYKAEVKGESRPQDFDIVNYGGICAVVHSSN